MSTAAEIAPRQYPLTSMQRAMVLASLRAPGSGAYVLQRICESSVRLDAGRLAAAWKRVVERHAALRMAIVRAPDGGFGLRVEAAPEIAWSFPEYRIGGMEGFLREDCRRGFPLPCGVPMRLALWHTPQGSQLLWTVHHALLDGRSVALVWRELFTIYDGLARGEEVALPAAPDFRTHLEWLAQQDFSRSETYWRRQWEGVGSTGYPADRLHSAHPAGAESFEREIRLADEGLTAGLAALAERLGASVNTLVLAAWGLLLSRYSGRREVVFGVARHCRSAGAPGASQMVGPLMNTLPFRLTVEQDAPLAPWLREVRAQWNELREHQHTPLDQVRAWSGLPAGMPPFESVVVYDREPLHQTLRQLGGEWECRQFRAQERTDTPLTLVAYGRPVLSLQLVYDTRLYCRETVSAMAGHLEELLRSFVHQPESRLRDVRLLTAAEEIRMLREWNATAAPIPEGLCAHQLFEQQARRAPERIALECGAVQLSYGEANRRANQFAWLLRERGIGPEDLVAIRLPSSPEAVLAILGILKAGAVFLPLDRSQPPARLDALIARAAPKFVLDDWETLRPELVRQPEGDLPPLAASANAAYAIFTSGSTGAPKAVVVTHRSLVNHILSQTRAMGISESDRRLQFVSMGSDVLAAEIFNTLSVGATLIFGREQAAGSMADYLRFLDARRVTLAAMPSTWWHQWVAALEAGWGAPPPSLRMVTTGMEAVNPAAFRAWKRLVGSRLRWFNAYGPTETSITALCYAGGSSPWENRFVPIGRPIANLRAYALDAQMRPVPAGIPGELYLGGAGVARGYLGESESTAARFLPDPFGGPVDRLYRTGDLVFALPDGNFVFLGRVDRQVKIRGYRVEPEEIEAVLAQHPAVRQCAVTVTAAQQLAAYLTLRKEVAPPDLADLRRHVARHLPAHMAPGVYFVLSAMPLTPSGKIDPRALPPDAAPLQPASARRAALSETEKRLAPLWEKALGRPPGSTTDDFFESGGDSLRATALLSALAREFGREFSFSTLQQAPTLARLAAMLEAGEVPGLPPVVLHRSGGARVPLFVISSASDDTMSFESLALRLHPDRPFAALRNPLERDDARVEELAATLCQTIRGIRPEGPYSLGGYCFGGLLAFEAARQLAAAGESIRMVALFDAPRPGYPRILGASASDWRRRLVSWRLLRPLAPSGAYAAAMVNAARRYTPGPVEFPLVQFTTRVRPLHGRLFGDPRLAWGDLSTAGFQVHELAGPHGHPFFERHGAEIAAQLDRVLD